MANVCMFDMKIVADTKENLEEFINALTHKGNVWIGRGAIICGELPTDDKTIKIISGEVPWSINSALMTRVEQEKEVLTLKEASSKYNIAIEIYSEEWGMAFEEHVIICCGDVMANDELDTDVTNGFKAIWNI